MAYNALCQTFVFLLACSHAFTQDTLNLSIYFDTDHYDLTSNHQDQIASFLDLHFAKDSIADILIQGYADRRGSNAYNIQLSERRVQSINNHLLISYGSRLNKTRSQALGSSLAGSDLNQDRRVDLTFYKSLQVHENFNTAIEVDDLSTVNSSLLTKGTNLKIKNLNFQPGRSKLLKSSIPQLKAVEQLLLKYPNLSIRISGHVCCAKLQNAKDGIDQDSNKKNLSEARAQNIYDYLIKKGIDKSRLSYVGYGYSRPMVTPELTEEDRISNRRVEFLITKS